MNLIPKECDVLKSYTDFLRWQDKDALDLSALNEEQAQRAMDPNTDINETIQLIVAASLSSKCLYLGVQILGDAPIWPIILSFAHGLQSRAIYSVTKKETLEYKSNLQIYNGGRLYTIVFTELKLRTIITFIIYHQASKRHCSIRSLLEFDGPGKKV